MKNIKIYIIILVSVLFGVLISITSSYALAESLVNSKDVYYEDNSNLLADNVQDAIDGTCTKFESKINNFLDKIYPVGSVYISTTLETVEKVHNALGGTWVVYGNGRTLLSSTGGSEKTGGQATTILTTNNIPSHTHDYDKVNSETGGHQLTIAEMPSHNHDTGTTSLGYWLYGVATDQLAGYAPGTGMVWSYHTTGITAQGGNMEHKHPIGTTRTQTTAFGSSNPTAINVQDPYITVYMYKRTA